MHLYVTLFVHLHCECFIVYYILTYLCYFIHYTISVYKI
jgi:hypothetical protein